ncbi:MAG: hypothetical protein WBO36_06400 [Saprospiraceae bacterium]
MSDSFDLIYSELNIDKNETLSDDQWMELIADRVEWFLEHDKDLLMSYLYRLDVSEQKIDKALTPGGEHPATQALAKLIFDRQKQRIATKLKYVVKPIDDWDF